MESGMLADMEVDKVADMFKTKCIKPEMFYLQSIGPKLFDACLLSFASLFSVNIYLRGCVSSAIQTSATPYFVSFATCLLYLLPSWVINEVDNVVQEQGQSK